MQAQYISESASQDTANHVVILQGTLISGSKGLTNNTLIKFIRKDYFDPAAKKEILLRTYPVNSAGWEYNSSIRYQVNLRHKYQWSFMAGISSVNAFGFNRETAQLVLNGNSFYAGQMMPLDGLKYYNMTWQYVGTGLTGKYKQWSWEGKLQFLYAQSFSKLTVRQGNLYTETNGEYINLRVDGNYISSKGVPFSNPGIGGQLGIGYNYKNHCAWGAGPVILGSFF